MKIAIDINELARKQNSGVKIYTREIVNALGSIDKYNEYVLYCQKSLQFLNLTHRPQENFELKSLRSYLPFWTYSRFPRELRKDKPDILFMPIQTIPFLFKPRNMKIVVTVHDLAFIPLSDKFEPKNRFFLNLHTKRAIKMADAIIVPSYSTRDDLVKFYSAEEEKIAEKINVIHHGVSYIDIKEPKAEEKNGDWIKFNEYKPYLLFAGEIQPRKNLIRLIEAFEIIKSGSENFYALKLVICGKRGWMADKVYKRAKTSKFAKDIVFWGEVSERNLAELYKNALIFIMPSLYEGFGLPVLEAMSFGAPCIVADNSSLREIADADAVLVNALSPMDMAEKINFLIKNSGIREDFSKRGIKRAQQFSWLESAKKHLEVFQKL